MHVNGKNSNVHILGCPSYSVWLSCHGYHVLVVRLGCPVLGVLSQFCPSSPVLVVMLKQFSPVSPVCPEQAEMASRPVPAALVLDVMSYLPCLCYPIQLSCACFPILPELFFIHTYAKNGEKYVF
jgi:hypothetical protein